MQWVFQIFMKLGSYLGRPYRYHIKITTSWNALPSEVVSRRTANSFKNSLDKQWAENPPNIRVNRWQSSMPWTIQVCTNSRRPALLRPVAVEEIASWVTAHKSTCKHVQASRYHDDPIYIYIFLLLLLLPLLLLLLLLLLNRYCERMWLLQWENYINLIMIFLLTTNHGFGICKQHLFDILFITCLKKLYLKIIC